MLLRKDKRLKDDLVEILAMRPAPQTIDELLQQVLYKRQRISMIIVVSRSSRVRLERLKRNIENLISFDPSLNAFRSHTIVCSNRPEDNPFIDNTLRVEYLSRVRRKRIIAGFIFILLLASTTFLYSTFR
jgi:tRNA(Ser,Leu) C12 N-acetylase TAN1